MRGENMQKVIFDRPANRWEEVLPIGNGSLGAMIWGDIEMEHLGLNLDTLWSGYYHDKNNRHAKEYLTEAREQIFAGNYQEAAKTVEEQLLGEFTESYLPMGEVWISIGGSLCVSPTEYRRELDLERAMATVSYQKGNTRYKREYFASYPDQAIVVCYTANQKMKVKIGFTSELSHQAYVEGNALRVEGQCLEHVEPSYIESDNPVIQGTRGLRFQTMITVQNTDGTIQEEEDVNWQEGSIEIDLEQKEEKEPLAEIPKEWKEKQDQLISEVLEVCPNAVVVIMAGSAVSMGAWEPKAKAIVWSWYSGMEGGNALAEVLLGKVNPSGKLPVSIPFKMEDCGANVLGEYPGRKLTKEEAQRMDAHSTVTYKDSIFVGYRYYDTYHVPVQYCFGHGLSYTDFSYQDLIVELNQTVPESLDAEMAVVKVRIENVGGMAGKEVVQVYVGKEESSQKRGAKELRGFQKVALKPGESKQAQIILDKRAFTYYDEARAEFVIEPGKYMIYVGSSLADIRLMGSVIIDE